jgi:hypothetical protein
MQYYLDENENRTRAERGTEWHPGSGPFIGRSRMQEMSAEQPLRGVEVLFGSGKSAVAGSGGVRTALTGCVTCTCMLRVEKVWVVGSLTLRTSVGHFGARRTLPQLTYQGVCATRLF